MRSGARQVGQQGVGVGLGESGQELALLQEQLGKRNAVVCQLQEYVKQLEELKQQSEERVKEVTSESDVKACQMLEEHSQLQQQQLVAEEQVARNAIEGEAQVCAAVLTEAKYVEDADLPVVLTFRPQPQGLLALCQIC